MFQDILEDAVRLRFRADAPVALTLSGGVDSTALAIAASRSNLRPIAYTSHFPEFTHIDESAFAAEAAEARGLEHILVQPTFDDLLVSEQAWTRSQGIPFGSLSGFIHWSIMREIRAKGTVVVLLGQGGDELFWGYESYMPYFAFSALPNFVKAARQWRIASSRIRIGWHMIPLYYIALRLPRLLDIYRKSRIRDVFSAAVLSRGGALLFEEDKHKPLTRREWQKRELLNRPLPSLLRQGDRTAGALGMETRLPFLDYRLVEFAYRLPWQHSFRDGWLKYLTRRYLERHGLDNLAWRTHKLGFNAPQKEWQNLLWREQGARLLRHPFAASLLRRGWRGFKWGEGRKYWDVYHLLRLAEIGDWRMGE